MVAERPHLAGQRLSSRTSIGLIADGRSSTQKRRSGLPISQPQSCQSNFPELPAMAPGTADRATDLDARQIGNVALHRASK
jgi:hypothetical protein